MEYRIAEELACSIFGPNEGRRIDNGIPIRIIKLGAHDSRWKALAELYWTRERKGFFGWSIKRTYSAAETRAARLHLLHVRATIIPTPEECGTAYNDRGTCPLCGSGRAQVTPLRLRLTRTHKRAEIAQSWGGEVIVSARVVRLMIDSGVTGFGLGPVQAAKKGEEEPFSFSQTPSGQRLLRLANEQGIPYPSPQFYVWLHGREHENLLQEVTREHEGTKHRGRRFAGGTSSDWYQLFVTSKPMRLAPSTRVGNGPFDNDLESGQRCPLELEDHVMGLNLLSQVTVPEDEWDGSDFARSRGLVGVRRGLFVPTPLLFISARLRDLLVRNSVKGWTSEVVDFSPS
jgi:hypothetical protein